MSHASETKPKNAGAWPPVKHTTQLLLVRGQRFLLVRGQRFLLVRGQRFLLVRGQRFLLVSGQWPEKSRSKKSAVNPPDSAVPGQHNLNAF
jgi:hypothetical protein